MNAKQAAPLIVTLPTLVELAAAAPPLIVVGAICVGTLDLYGYIDNNLSEESFGFFARRWWILLESYVFEIRKKRVNTSLYINFERFAKSHSSGNSIYNEKEIQEFLNDEYSLSIP